MRRRPWSRALTLGVMMATAAIVAYGLTAEVRTSWLQSELMSRAVRSLTFRVEPGPSDAIRFPSAGPYDQRLGYVDAGVAVVIGTSGLTAADLDELDAKARERSVGVVASGNFSLTAAMCQAAALLAARHLPQWEVIDYASASKPDVPSGTARELAERLGEIRRPELGHPLDGLHGPREARGATVDGTQIHSVRLPSFVVSTEVVFAAPDERLTIRHDAGGTPEPYVQGTLLAVRKVVGRVGLTRGLDTLLLESG